MRFAGLTKDQKKGEISHVACGILQNKLITKLSGGMWKEMGFLRIWAGIDFPMDS